MKPFTRQVLILATSLCLLAGVFAAAGHNHAASIPPVDLTNACQYGQCNAIAKSTGARCKHCVSKAGDLYCWQHK